MNKTSKMETDNTSLVSRHIQSLYSQIITNKKLQEVVKSHQEVEHLQLLVNTIEDIIENHLLERNVFFQIGELTHYAFWIAKKMTYDYDKIQEDKLKEHVNYFE